GPTARIVFSLPHTPQAEEHVPCTNSTCCPAGPHPSDDAASSRPGPKAVTGRLVAPGSRGVRPPFPRVPVPSRPTLRPPTTRRRSRSPGGDPIATPCSPTGRLGPRGPGATHF